MNKELNIISPNKHYQLSYVQHTWFLRGEIVSWYFTLVSWNTAANLCLHTESSAAGRDQSRAGCCGTHFHWDKNDAGKLGLSQKWDVRHPRALAGGITHRSGTCSGPEAREKSLFLSDGASAAKPLRLREREVQKDKNMSLSSPVRK